MGLSTVLFLGAAVLLLAALYLSPLASFAYFGSDSGEYYRLTVDLVGTGHLPVGGAYGGWGTGYPDFPGLFVVAGAAAGATGADPLTALAVAVPLLAAASVAPLFLLFRRLVPNDLVALFGAGLAGVMMPRAFSIAHPAPLALGDLFVVAGLWMFVEGRTDPRWYVPLALTASALIVTHHLSSYFFLLCALGALFFVEMVRPNAWGRRFPARELGFLAAFGAGMALFWTIGAPDFARVVIAPSLPASVSVGEAGIGLAAAAVLVPLLIGVLIRWRRAHARRPLRASFPSDASVGRDAAILAVATAGGIAALLFVPLPGTIDQTTTASAILFYVPILLCIPLVSGTRRLLTIPRLGPLALGLLLLVGASAAVGLATQNSLLQPARHAEYLVIPLGLLVALSFGRWVGRASDGYGRPAALALVAAALLLVAANAAIVYPPPSALGGFQEGLTPRDAVLAEWASVGLPAGTVVASDHRLSSYLFGIDGDRATWGSTYGLFCGTNRTSALAELAGSPAPTVPVPIDAVAIDGVMRANGVALNPSALAVPISPAADGWLAAPPFVPLYENGAESVDWVDAAALPAP